MSSFASFGLRRWWDPDDREAVRAANAELWPAVREQLLSGVPSGTALTDLPEFREFLRDAVLHDGWGAEDVAVWFGVSGQRARVWVGEVLDPGEVEDCGPTSWRAWALDRFVPIDSDEAKALYTRASRGNPSGRLEADVRALQRYVDEVGEVPRTGEFADYLGDSYQNVGNRWPGSYAEGWDALYAAAGYDRPGAYNLVSGN